MSDINLENPAFLHLLGWRDSVTTNSCIDENGDFIPWYNYSAIYFLKQRLSSSMNIFEYGSGYSTLFFAKYCNSVISSETREKWRDLITNLASENGLENININLIQKHEFVQSISLHSRKFDIIIVDSEFRNDCIAISTDFITDDGIVILDNSDRQELYKSFEYMESMGFKNIEFMGIKPNSDMPSRTTIFYRENNIFNI